MNRAQLSDARQIPRHGGIGWEGYPTHIKYLAEVHFFGKSEVLGQK
jgi:saccharopine dehydrogenase-like NADP-dependent oxidoreductase